MIWRTCLGVALLGLTTLTLAQEQIVKADPAKRGPLATKDMTLRVRVVKAPADVKAFAVQWKRGGQGLGGLVYTGDLASTEKSVTLGEWTAAVPLDLVTGKGGWVFPNIIATSAVVKKGKPATLTDLVIEMEFADKGRVFKSLTETAPKGCTASFAYHGAAASRAEFETALQPLSHYVKDRLRRLEQVVSPSDPSPKKFAILGHHGGYGEGAGYAIRHNNPEIAADESRTQRLLGVNGMVGKKALDAVDAAGLGQDFRRLYFGGPGAGSPMAFFKPKPGQEVTGCPFDPELHKAMAQRVRDAIAEHQAAGAKESWAEWWDEMGVATKEHMQTCPRCRERYEAYLRAHGVTANDVGFADAAAIKPFPLWQFVEKGKKGPVLTLTPAPTGAAAALNYYYTFRFMTYATGQLFPDAAAAFAKAKIPLFAMQGPTPSWSGASLDWHEFYDQKANTAAVWETSNRDPRVWQFESYLADIMRGIAQRLRLLIGTLVKPHRGAPEQRLLAAVSRGATTIEWYTYGPDYARGDSFSQRPDLLDRVAKVNRLLARAEDRLYGARWAGQPEVAFVTPRSSEILGKATNLGVTAFENAKWVYLALAHAHIPVDILSEQQLAEGKLDRYKVIYVPGPHLRRDAATQLRRWVEAGGLLWTDALGLSRDEANQPASVLSDLLPAADRKLERWGLVEGYGAVILKPLVENSTPDEAMISWNKGKARAWIGREPLAAVKEGAAAHFADGKPAVVRRRIGKGEVVVAGWWTGLSYSARVRRPDFDMAADFDPAQRHWITAPALERGVWRPVVPELANVEAVLLESEGKRSIVLMNWSYRHTGNAKAPHALNSASNLRVRLPGLAEVKSARSLLQGDLHVEIDTQSRWFTLPRLDEVDVVFLD